MDLSLFDYHLPRKLIAQQPLRKRDESRLLVYDRGTGETHHLNFKKVTGFIKKGDALVVNNTKVFKARLIGRRKTGAQVEVLLTKRAGAGPKELWEGLLRPSRRVRIGEEILFGSTDSLLLEADVGGGKWQVRFSSKTARERIISRFGHVPLPPYINRADQLSDVRRYQTLFAEKDKTGAIAAPTAGFHFTRKILKELAGRGVEIIELTLHVGPGTFKPIQAEDIRNHRVDPEQAELSSKAAGQLNRVRQEGGAIFAVGTTSVRTLESAPMVDEQVQPFAGMVDLYIRPGCRFRVIDHLLTNFHLPKSSLLVLVSAFAGREEVLGLYQEAIRRQYRFYSYGDAMLLL